MGKKMTFDLQSLELLETYEFNVIVEDGKERFAGKLNLAPEKTTITIMGEQHNERKCSIGWDNLSQLTCTDINKKFFLYDLRLCRARNSSISRHPKSIGYFEAVFEVGFVVFCPFDVYEDNFVESINIHSEAINDWVGNTVTQENILSYYRNKKPLFNYAGALDEFVVGIDGVGTLGVPYNLSMHVSSLDFKSGILFPPSLLMHFNRCVDAEEMKRLYDKIYNLISFLVGNDVLVSKVDIGCGGLRFSNSGSLYYSSRSFRPKYNDGVTLFPLGKDLRFDSLGLPSMPLGIFNNYFSLSDTEIEYWGKYLKYKRMNNVEERFLGYFRLLEALVFKQKSYLDEAVLANLCEKSKAYLIRKFDDEKNVKRFLRGVPRYNKSKYNTEKCIQDFYELMPVELSSKWKFKKCDIGGMCKLRNDITHANEYYESEGEIEGKTKFIESLLVLALCLKLGVDLKVSVEFIYRISGYQLIASTE
ncbi:MAG: HEPN domain-containing protein [Pseudomonadota bacterium]